jgi:hypothetical protein
LDEHAGATTVIDIAGISVEGVSAGAAQNPSGKVGFIHAAHPNIFVAKLTNGSGAVQVADQANVGVQYGILKNGTGLDQWWSIDEADVTNVVAEILDIDTERNVVFFMFLNSAVQGTGAFG